MDLPPVLYLTGLMCKFDAMSTFLESPDRALDMANTGQSKVAFRRDGPFTPITSASEVTLEAMSQGDAWFGIHLEIGVADTWDGGDTMVAGHFVSMNVAPHDLCMSIFNEETASWEPRLFPPNTFWIHPEGSSFAHLRTGKDPFSGAIIDGQFLDSILGAHYEIVGGIGVSDPILENLFRALIVNLREGAPQPELTQALVRGFVTAFGWRHGRKAQPLRPGYGLNSAQIASITKWMEERLDQRVSVDAMAAQIGLSPAHFSREFKRKMGRTPWEHLIELRLDRARRMLSEDEGVSETALRCGFFDQAHLSRAFKQRFKVSPSAFARQVRLVCKP